MKIENRSRKRSHKLDGIGVGRVRTVSFSSDSAYDSDAYDPVKTTLSELQAEAEAQEPTNRDAGLFLGFRLRPRQSSFHWIISIGVVGGIGRKWNCSDSTYDSDFRFSLVRSALTTPTPSPVKTSLKRNATKGKKCARLQCCRGKGKDLSTAFFSYDTTKIENQRSNW